MRSSYLLVVAIYCVAQLSFGCAPTSPTRHIEGYSLSAADKAADTALTMVGRPYKYRGDSPAGFDCSGLVRYSYLTAGMDVPHGTKALRRATRPISSHEIRKGDILFFLQDGKKYSHVGIYMTDNHFVHAPSTGRAVRMDTLLDPYWKEHFLEARRFKQDP